MKIVTKALTKALIMVSLLATAANATAGHHKGDSFYARGKVISATPIYQTVRVEHVHDSGCWTRVRHHHSSGGYHTSSGHHGSNEVAATVVGAVIGGTVGHVLFKKSDLKGVGTVAGAIIGGSVGNDIGRHSHSSGHYSSGYRHASHRKVLHCRQEYTSFEEITGYDVTYKYQGDIYHTRTRHHPGKKIKLKVTVDPV
ncbi:glycine zipper 2TM domain-containing protein [Thalassomonas viridans]|uniref:Glycine zipper 2TM domain-containing protein n=1 Tax=Thalassomonas viridans TaxID=137584 RepID=A0AAF0CAF3_9GAMM|nr:glycine zipper 2TM domain-containing protein [Thalassomonas viridans]WDE06808.1 glycine zipper 2TM domain-containing protein [Thalassomonas viridans]